MIKAIFFDLHKVVTYGEFAAIEHTVARRANVSPEVVTQFHRDHLDGLLVGSVTSQDMLTAFGLDAKMTVPQLLAIWTEEVSALMYADPAILELLLKLRNNYTLAALTNLTEQRYEADVFMGLYAYFDFSILSFKEGIKKPDHRFFLRALEEAACLPSEAVFIDDQIKNTDAAQELGIHAIQYKNYEHLMERLKLLGVEV